MAILILFSALFSGSEAALFSLDRRSLRGLSRAGLGGRIASRLLQTPERLLSAILFWNLLINMTYFAFAAIVGGRLEQDPSAGGSVAVIFTVISLLAIIFFSEMLPKSLAVLAPRQLSVFVAPPLSIAVRLVSPVLPLVTVTNLAVSRLVWPNFQPEPEIELSDIERAIELGTDDAALLQRERKALRGLVGIADTRVSEIMRPRSKLLLCKEPLDRQAILNIDQLDGYLMVTDESGEMIIKALNPRLLRPSQLDDLDSACEAVIYVPWSAMVSQVLDRLNEEDRVVAVVVNEFGESQGAVSLDDILSNVLSPPNEDEWFEDSSITETAPGRLRVAGSDSLRRLSKRLDIAVSSEGVSTVAGYLQRLNERFPRVGDTAALGDYVLTVTEESEDGIWIEVVAREDSQGSSS
ncbi:MAG: CNNM domain-containing protein [Planctomycetota bacterium]